MKTTHCDYDKWALEILELVRVLHFRGFQRLRVCAGSSPSGNNWHIALTPASNILCSNGARMADFGKAVYHSTADSSDLFGWHGIDDRSPVGLADRLMDEWPELCATARGRDWDYVGWFAEMLRFAARAFCRRHSRTGGICRKLYLQPNMRARRARGCLVRLAGKESAPTL